MSIAFTSQKFKPSSLETRTNLILNDEKLEVITDNLEGVKQITLSNGEIIEDVNQISQYENKIFDAVIKSGISEQLIQLANLLKIQARAQNKDNSSIKASLATRDDSKLLNIVAFIEGDRIQSLGIYVNEKQWNISFSQEDKDLVKYCKFLKDKLSATPQGSQSLDLNQLLKVAKLDVPIMETPLKDLLKSYVEYQEFPYYTPDDEEYRQYSNNKSLWPWSYSYLNENGKLPIFDIRDKNCYKEDGYYNNYIWYPLTHNPDYDDLEWRKEHRQIHGYSICKWQSDNSEIESDLINQRNFVINDLETNKSIKVESFKRNFIEDKNQKANIYNHIQAVIELLFILNMITNINGKHDEKGYLFGREDKKHYDVFSPTKTIDISLITKFNNEELSKYIENILLNLDSVSNCKLFSLISPNITRFENIIKQYQELSKQEFCQQIYQQTVKSFQDEPEKLEIILSNFFKLTQEPIFKSSSNILTTAQTTLIESKIQENSNNLETKIELSSSFPEPITGILIASNQVNTDTQLNFIASENSLRSINKEDIATYQNKLFKEIFSETLEADKVLFLANCLKFTDKESESNQYSGILATNDESHQLNYKLTPIQQNQYNLNLESLQFNWKYDYQINLNNLNHVNFLHRLDSDLVQLILSLNNQETVLKKAITLTPHHEAENYNSGYLTTPNSNNCINYQIQVNSENNQNQFELSVNNKTWVYQLNTFNLDHRIFLQQVNPSLAVALETQKALTALANDDKIKTVSIRRQNNQNHDAISVYSKDESTTELTVLIPSSQTDSSLQSILSPSQEIRIEKTYINDSLGYKLSFPSYDADAKPIKITQIIDSTGKIQVQTTEEHPVKVFSDGKIVTHHSDRVSSETIEVEYKDYLEDANFTYHASGQLIVSNLIEGMKVEHYVQPPIQNILNCADESFIILKPEDKIALWVSKSDYDKIILEMP
ncbi:MAG: hypothetical protein F6K54_14020 [Okeania sp. SIO3B5]|uniref:hypothetical protein n=1 Tax=Okeania sp. SIO3B5 TaxID=2607811 RepID=UPI0013FEE835|nr:hypothetical protein [Okeania sp. SIO3B5]NEO54099.1 hypothetical protein [Okeania sp. SIO3B5]